MSTKIAVIESRWHSPSNRIQRNTTVRPLFELLSDLHYGNHHSFEYEMVATKPALDEALQRMAKSRRVTVAYLAMHGGYDGLHLHSGVRVSRTVLKNTLREITQSKGASLSGLYLGACLFGVRSLAEFIFRKDVSLSWVAGYSEEVDFISSTALDLLFFHTLLEVREEMPNATKLARVKEVARRMRTQARGLCRTPLENGDPHCGLGFSIFVRKQGPKRGVVDLIRDVA